MSQGRTLAHWLAKGDDGQDKDRDGITYQTTFTPPVEVARVARAGLEAHKEGVKGGTAVGLARARQLAAREPVSLDTIRRIDSFHGRHDAQADGPRRRQARLLWGGAAGKAWAAALWSKHKDSVTT